jgi:hypothetical protein
MANDCATGIYVRIYRDGAWHNLDIVELTDGELTGFFEPMNPAAARAWAVNLVRWLQANLVPGPGEVQAREGGLPELPGEN